MNDGAIKFNGFGDTISAEKKTPVEEPKKEEIKEFKPVIEEDTNIPKKKIITAEEMLKKEEPIEFSEHNPFM